MGVKVVEPEGEGIGGPKEMFVGGDEGVDLMIDFKHVCNKVGVREGLFGCGIDIFVGIVTVSMVRGVIMVRGVVGGSAESSPGGEEFLSNVLIDLDLQVRRELRHGVVRGFGGV